MKNKLLLLSGFLSLSLSAFNATALPKHSDVNTELLLAPKCFITNNSFEYNELAYHKSNDMVFFGVNREYWWQQLDKLNHKPNCGKFINVTDEWQQYLQANKLNSERGSVLDYEYFLRKFLADSNAVKSISFNKVITGGIENNQELLANLYQEINQDRIGNSLDELSSHYNRAAHTNTGYQAALHVKTWMEDLLNASNRSPDDFAYELIQTNLVYRQPSVVAVLGKNLPGKALVIGAHLDTVGGGRRPGVDDDGCGSVVVLETARLLVNSDHQFNRPIYFIWYAAEEAGLVGSKKVVQAAIDRGIEIDSVLQLDVIGRRAKAEDPTMWFLKDYVNLDFTSYLATLAKDYVKVPVDYTVCGYACSDHASWTAKGFVAGAGVESAFSDINPYIHSAEDTKEHVYMDNMVNFTKLALAYAVDKAA
jgi:leucyl aminopeptidase